MILAVKVSTKHGICGPFGFTVQSDSLIRANKQGLVLLVLSQFHIITQCILFGYSIKYEQNGDKTHEVKVTSWSKSNAVLAQIFGPKN